MRGQQPFSSPLLRLVIAYTIGVNVFGLVLGLSYVVASLLHLDMASVAGLIGGLAGIALGVVAGWRTEKALKRISWD
jgi:multisubunit Na+/H+ antiporter MnhF subunit